MDTFSLGLVVFGGATFGIGALLTWAYLRSLGWERAPRIDISGMDPTGWFASVHPKDD